MGGGVLVGMVVGRRVGKIVGVANISVGVGVTRVSDPESVELSDDKMNCALDEALVCNCAELVADSNVLASVTAMALQLNLRSTTACSSRMIENPLVVELVTR